MDLNIPSFLSDRISQRGLETIKKVKQFVEEDCIPADDIYLHQISTDVSKRWVTTPEIVEKLKVKAKKLNLWNLFLSSKYKEGPGYSNLEYGLMAQFLGRSLIAPEVTNTNAPDTGNIEVLAKYANQAQREKWLKPLLEGEIRSAFLMTEKGVSSSNALNISCSAIEKNGKYILTGVKWFASGAGDPRCAVWLLMCKTSNSKKSPYSNHSVLLVDTKSALESGKAKVVRPLEVFGFDDAPHGHCEIEFNELEVPKENAVIFGLGKGFEIVQSRLGPGRIHHCMRLIGMGEEGLIQVTHRANNRQIFGVPLKKRETFLTKFVQSKIEIEKCRLLVLNAAYKIDVSNSKLAQYEIAIAKIETPKAIQEVLDWCIQMYGAEGVSQDTKLTKFWISARMLRIADGPDEAHLYQLGRHAARKFTAIEKYFEDVEKNNRRLTKL